MKRCQYPKACKDGTNTVDINKVMEAPLQQN